MEETRCVPLGGRESSGDGGGFPSNRITTSKYTPATFLPLNLWEQFHKLGNVYFLCISVLMYLGEHTRLFIGTIKAWSTVFTLMAMMMITAIVALRDDHRRKVADAETNAQDARIANTGQVVTKTWEEVAVGDILLVKNGEELPADLVLLFCTGVDGICYVSTANLDGETNLKPKAAVPGTQKLLGGSGEAGASNVSREATALAALASLAGGDVEAETPRTSIHTFSGRLAMPGEGATVQPLGAKEFLLRGTVLRNTAFCIGVVVYTGKDTRIMRNAREVPSKQSTLEQMTNSVMVLVLLGVALLALLSDLLYLINKASFHGLWYLHPPDLILPDILSYWLTFIVLYSNMMPISLYPTIEWCNAYQTYFIQNDINMYWPALDFPAVVRSSSLCQELGQVQYIFSDKTGTLTQNMMDLKRFLIQGSVYGNVTKEKGFSGGKEIQAARDAGRGEEIDRFLEVLAVCHTVVASSPDDGGPIVYEAESPDEAALVEGVAELGWRFTGRIGDRLLVSQTEGEKEYIIRAVNEFTSTRKRMSLVVERRGEYFVFCKGADNIVIARSSSDSATIRTLTTNLDKFADEGLRTLVVARRTLRPDEFKTWLAKYVVAERAMNDREVQLTRVAEEIEVDLEIVGATAVEDRLQENVPQTIDKLRAAGINLWVLTGDKLETAKNIGFSSGVLVSGMTIAELADGCADAMEAALDREIGSLKGLEKAQKAIMVTGEALEAILEAEQLQGAFWGVARDCAVVIGCRVSPLQKARVVQLCRERAEPSTVTLAIGDGANDVPMIQEAHVGVGIAGKEGRQAVNNSDFAVAQFNYLQRLLLVHGRWNYRRICKVTVFTFWRNAVQSLLIFYYTFSSGFSGTSIFESWIRQSFNFLCSLPILATGCFDQDVTDRVALDNPKLYECGRLRSDLNPSRMIGAFSEAIVHSIIIQVLTRSSFRSMELLGVGDYYSFGTAVFTCLLLDMNCRVGLMNCTHNKFTIGAMAVSFALYILWLVVYPSTALVSSMLSHNMYMVPYHLAVNLPFWLCLLAVPIVTLSADLFVLFFWRSTDKASQDLLAVQRHAGRGAREDDPLLLKVPEEHAGPPLPPPPDHLDMSDLAQQKFVGFHSSSTHAAVQKLGFGAGVLLIILGCIALHESRGVAQMRIHYDGDGVVGDPLGTLPSDVWQVQDSCGSLDGKTGSSTFAPAPSSCNFSVAVTKRMTPPILIHYAVGPFYQNFNTYLKSEVPKELGGLPMPDNIRTTLCKEPHTRLDPKQQQIVPCGLKVVSMFNDTFSVDGYDIDPHGIAWESDVRRYQNPPDYLKRPKTAWPHDLYPDIISEKEGVKSEHFAAWMRPSALSTVVKRYGWLDKELSPGTVLNISIRSVYPVHPFDGYKQLVLTELGPLGGRQDDLALGLVGGGVAAVLLSLGTWFLMKQEEARSSAAAPLAAEQAPQYGSIGP